MSLAPRPPARVEAKISVRPSWESVGWVSPAVVFSGAPRFTGGDQGSCTLRRVDVHRSFPPEPPARLEYRNTSRPSTRTDGWASVIAGSGSFSSATGTAGPRVSPSAVTATTYMSSATLFGPREKYRF